MKRNLFYIILALIAFATSCFAEDDPVGHALARKLRQAGHSIVAYGDDQYIWTRTSRGYVRVYHVFVHIHDQTTGHTYAITDDGEILVQR